LLNRDGEDLGTFFETPELPFETSIAGGGSELSEECESSE
jgi:hypothetical protein